MRPLSLLSIYSPPKYSPKPIWSSTIFISLFVSKPWNQQISIKPRILSCQNSKLAAIRFILDASQKKKKKQSLTCHHLVLGYRSNRRNHSETMAHSSDCMRVLLELEQHGDSSSMHHDYSSCVVRLELLELYHATMHCHRLGNLFMHFHNLDGRKDDYLYHNGSKNDIRPIPKLQTRAQCWINTSWIACWLLWSWTHNSDKNKEANLLLWTK